ncbi:MAG: PKD domain-containing protein [Candidatus Nanopelagicales bacterium]|nr:PKD domain-containing protein [Candidatus Nanopelagicales bacterium]
MRRSRIFVLLLLALGVAVPYSPHAVAVEVESNDATDQFVGSSSQKEQHSGSSQSNNTHACANCLWMLGDPCSSQYNDIGCGTVTDGCPPGQEQRRQWFSQDDGVTWEDRGLTCVGGNTLAVDPGDAKLQAAFERSVPAAHITWQPPAGLLPHVPVLFDSGQPQDAGASTHGLGSASVTLIPRATWTWEFGDGGQLATSIAGSRYPQQAVSHRYRHSGTFPVTLTTAWSATYTVNGQGPFVVDGQITQESHANVTVGQGRAVLTPGQ